MQHAGSPRRSRVGRPCYAPQHVNLSVDSQAWPSVMSGRRRETGTIAPFSATGPREDVRESAIVRGHYAVGGKR